MEHGLVSPRQVVPAEEVDPFLGSTGWTHCSSQFSADPAFRSCAFSMVTDQTGRGWALPGVQQSVHRVELLPVTLLLEWLRGSGPIVSACKGVVKMVAAFRGGGEAPRRKHIDLSLESRSSTPVEWIKAHTAMSQRRSLGIAEEHFLGNDRADVGAKAPLAPTLPHGRLGGSMLRSSGAFGPTLARWKTRPGRMGGLRARGPQSCWGASPGEREDETLRSGPPQ